jgi:hypothetical protein
VTLVDPLCVGYSDVTNETADQTSFSFLFFFFLHPASVILVGEIYLFMIEFHDKGRKLLFGFFKAYLI